MSFASSLPWNKYGMIIELTRRLQGISPQLGKTALQKMIYLLTAVYCVPSGYEHTLYTYGPYSAELTSDTEYLAAIGGVSIREGSRGGYEIATTENSMGILAKSQGFTAQFEKQLNQLIEDFGAYSARELELRSTLIFLAKEDSFNQEQLKRQLLELKPYFNEVEVLSTIDELEARQFITV